ncbi:MULTISPECIES: VOC family protein [Jeotgalicoccus]|uniref:VOC family protein n=1 Tax=Jeotgalicoccus TaxID=227979 RepID=UPI0004094AD5|nr:MULTISPECIES: VOC family protein [Jeotgalicoccus]
MKAAMPLISFNGTAFSAIEYYKEIFRDLEILQFLNYENSSKVQQAVISIGDLNIVVRDAEIPTGTRFNPEVSLYLECESLEEIELLYRKLKKNGAIHVPLDDYNLSKRYAIVQDQFGLYWQLNLS